MLDVRETGNGYNVNSFSTELKSALESSSQKVFAKPAVYFGMGGSIPFIELLGNMYPECVLLVTGVLGPGSNAHGPDESLDIKYLQQVMHCLVLTLAHWK